MTYQDGPGGRSGGWSPSNPDGGDPPAPLDPIAELERAPVRIGTPIHYVAHGNPSGAPCNPGIYMGFDGREAHVFVGQGPRTALYSAPGAGPGPVFTYGTFHLAARCEVTGPVDPPQQVAQDDGPPLSTDEFRSPR